eukprot:42616-Hanusia_phi.AAC.1
MPYYITPPPPPSAQFFSPLSNTFPPSPPSFSPHPPLPPPSLTVKDLLLCLGLDLHRVPRSSHVPLASDVQPPRQAAGHRH